MGTSFSRASYFVLPSLSYCEMNAQRSLTSLSFLMPAKGHLGAGDLGLGSLMYSLNSASFQLMPEFLLASEWNKTFGGAGLAAVEPVELGATLFLAPRRPAWQGRHLLNEVLRPRRSCASAEVAAADDAMTTSRAQDQFFS